MITNIVKVDGVYVLYLTEKEGIKYNDASNVIGHLQFIVNDENKIFISFIDVKETERRKSFGKKMIMECLNYCRNNYNSNYVYLESMSTNTPQNNLFYKLGMRYTEGWLKDPAMHGNVYKMLRFN